MKFGSMRLLKNLKNMRNLIDDSILNRLKIIIRKMNKFLMRSSKLSHFLYHFSNELNTNVYERKHFMIECCCNFEKYKTE